MTASVLNTRPRGQAAELTRLLEAAGLGVVEAPAIATSSAWDPATLEAVRAEIVAGGYAWVVLPSQNAGRELVDALSRGQARVVCGASTARALGLEPAVALERFSASAALSALDAEVRAGQSVLVPRAVGASGEFVRALQTRGARVHAPVAYRTVAVEQSALAEAASRVGKGEVHVVTACSPSAIAALLAVMSRESLATCELVCLGATTAEAARRAGLRVDAVAEQTTMASLVDAVRAALTRAGLAA